MFAIEFTSVRPAGSAPYYSLVIREDPYMVGCLPITDVCLPCHDVSPQHATLEVVRLRQAEAALRASEDADEVRSEHEEVDPALQDPALLHGGAAASARRSDDDDDVDPNIAAAERAAAGEGDSDAPGAGDLVEDHPHHKAAAHHTAPTALTEDDPLVVRLTALPTKGDGAILVDGRELASGDSALLRNGDVVQFGSAAAVVLRFRPLVVSIEGAAFAPEYTRDLVYMYRRLGATLCNVISGPTADLREVPTPIGLLHCTEELGDSDACIVALACGYSVVQPTYVFEWFASLAQNPSLPLSVLPPPSRFEVPVRTTLHPRSTMYVRPESDTCPYSLYPIPSTAMRKRNRVDLFLGTTVFFATAESMRKYGETVAQCGGIVYGPHEATAVKEALSEMVAEQANPNLTLTLGEEEHPYPRGFYVIVDNVTEATMLNEGLRAANSELCQFMEDVNVLGATHVPVMGDHSLFTSLLSNAFSYEPVQYSVDPPAAAPQALAGPGGNTSAGGGAAGAGPLLYRGAVAPSSASDDSGSAGVRRGTHYRSQHQDPAQQQQAVPLSASARRQRRMERRTSLLPRDHNRTPTRSQMRSASRQRQRSASLAGSDGAAGGGGGDGIHPAPSVRTRSGSRGRRHLVRAAQPETLDPSKGPVNFAPLSLASRFNILRLRIYAFLVKEEARLDEAAATYTRNHFVDNGAAERALESKAQAEDYMELVDDLLDEDGYGQYADSLRRFWRDCSDLAVKADGIVANFDHQGRSGAYRERRRSPTYVSRRASSASRSSAGGNEIFHVDGEDGHRSGPPGADASASGDLRNAGASATDASGDYYRASAGTPRASSRAGTPRVRDHCEAYASINLRRSSLLAASQSQSQSQSLGDKPRPSQSGGIHRASVSSTSPSARNSTSAGAALVPPPPVVENAERGAVKKGVVQSAQQRGRQRAAEASPASVRTGSHGRRESSAGSSAQTPRGGRGRRSVSKPTRSGSKVPPGQRPEWQF